MDLTDADAVARTMSGLAGLDAAVVYAPGAAPTAVQLIAAAVSGPVVEIFTSRWAAPESPDPLPSVGVPLLLGWARDAHGPSRWHTAREISDAALEVLASGEPAQLGAVRPWAERPR